MAKQETKLQKTNTYSNNLKQKNYALLGLLVALVVILFAMSMIKVDITAAMHMK